MKRKKAKGIEVIVYEPVLKEELFFGSKVEEDFNKFINDSEIIIGGHVSPSKRIIENENLKDKIMKIYVDSKRRYGSPKITQLLNSSLDKPVSIKRVQRLMNNLGIRSIVTRKFRYHSKMTL